METWDRQPQESAKAHSAFLDYCRMGPGRSLGKLSAIYRQKDGDPTAGIPPTRLLRTLERWSSKYGWQKRVEAWDAELQRQEQARWEERQRQVRDADWQMGEELRALAGKILEQTPQFIKTTRRLVKGKKGESDREVITLGIDVTGLVRAAEAGSKLQRQATGMPDSVQQIEHSGEVKVLGDITPDMAKAAQNALRAALEARNTEPDDGDNSSDSQ